MYGEQFCVGVKHDAERKGDVSIEDREIHDESNVMSTAHRQER